MGNKSTVLFFLIYTLLVRLKEQQEELQLKRTQLIKENRKAQKKVDQYDKLLDDFVQVRIISLTGLCSST